ncbi:putative signal transducing protein [Hymenobacter tenuis]
MFSDSDAAGPAIVLLDTFADTIAAHLAKNRLDAEGIPCFLSNENRPYGSVLSGGVRLYVREPDVAAAQDLLHPHRTPMHALPHEAAETAAGTPRCPRCQHHDVVCRHLPQPTDTLFTKLRLWLLAPEKPQCHCFTCGHDFEG